MSSTTMQNRHIATGYINVEDIGDAKIGLISVKSQSKLRKLLPNWLKLDNCIIQGVVAKHQRLNWVRLANMQMISLVTSLVND